MHRKAAAVRMSQLKNLEVPDNLAAVLDSPAVDSASPVEATQSNGGNGGENTENAAGENATTEAAQEASQSEGPSTPYTESYNGSDDEDEQNLDEKSKACRSLRLKDQDVLIAIRSVGSRHWLTCLQLRRLLCLMKDAKCRCEVLICLVMRCLDWPVNGKICRPKFTRKNWENVQRKLGYIVLFPFMQPEHAEIKVDLRNYEQRKSLSLFVSLQNQETPNCIAKAKIDRDGPRSEPHWDTFIAGVPLSWDQCDNVPQHGIFEGMYNSSADFMRMKVRRKLAHSIGGWTNIPEDQFELKNYVQLWAVLDELPIEVVQWANFCVSKYPSLTDTFTACDKSGDGNLSLKEFVEGFLQLGFRLPPDPGDKNAKSLRKKSLSRRSRQMSVPSISGASENSAAASEPKEKKPEEAAEPISPKPKAALGKSKFAAAIGKVKKDVGESRAEDARCVMVLTAVYRFMDPNNDGAVSLPEFMSLQGMWRELRMATWEFVDHVKQTFGCLEQAWHYADSDGSGEMDFDEFSKLAQKWHFFGPLQQIYMFLDDDGSNSVGKEEWMKLGEVTADVTS